MLFCLSSLCGDYFLPWSVRLSQNRITQVCGLLEGTGWTLPSWEWGTAEGVCQLLSRAVSAGSDGKCGYAGFMAGIVGKWSNWTVEDPSNMQTIAQHPLSWPSLQFSSSRLEVQGKATQCPTDTVLLMLFNTDRCQIPLPEPRSSCPDQPFWVTPRRLELGGTFCAVDNLFGQFSPLAQLCSFPISFGNLPLAEQETRKSPCVRINLA